MATTEIDIENGPCLVIKNENNMSDVSEFVNRLNSVSVPCTYVWLYINFDISNVVDKTDANLIKIFTEKTKLNTCGNDEYPGIEKVKKNVYQFSVQKEFEHTIEEVYADIEANLGTGKSRKITSTMFRYHIADTIKVVD